MLAAIGAAVVPWKTAALRARWEAPCAQPGAPARVIVRAPDAPDGGVAEITVVIETPTERLVRPSERVVLRDGSGELALSLDYPYEGRVAGSYRYWAEVRVGALVARTERPIAYSVRDARWFA